jgi:hypothetical protein
MQAVMRQAICSVPNPSICLGCRVVAGRRHRKKLYERNFTSTSYLRHDPDRPLPSTTSLASQNEDDLDIGLSQESQSNTEVAGGDDGVPSMEDRFRKAKERNYGSASRRVGRNRKPKEITSTQIPAWFLRDNVQLAPRSSEQTSRLSIAGDLTQDATAVEKESTPEAETLSDGEVEESSTSRYTLNPHVWKEILLTVRGGLELAPQAHSESLSARKSHVVLQCPKDGGVQFLESVVEKIAIEISADMISLDAQDIAEVSGEFLNEDLNSGPNKLQSLGYDAHQLTTKQEAQESEEAAEEEEEFDDDEDEDNTGSRSSQAIPGFPSIANVSVIPMGGVFSNLQDMIRSGKLFAGRPPSTGTFGSLPTMFNKNQDSSPDGDEVRIQVMLEALIGTAQIKRIGSESPRKIPSQPADPQHVQTPQEISSLPKVSRPLIIHIQDYKEINATLSGSRLLIQLYEMLQRRRQEGQHILLVGTTSSADLLPALSKSGIKAMQSEVETSSSRTIIVTPERSRDTDASFIEDERRRTRHVNTRHLRHMIQQRAPSAPDEKQSEAKIHLDSTSEFVSGISESVWPFDRVHRLAQMVIGAGKPDLSQPENIAISLDALIASDEVKYRWVSEEKQQEAALSKVQIHTSTPNPADPSRSEASDKLKRIRKQCNSHEKKLLSGIIDPGMMYSQCTLISAKTSKQISRPPFKTSMPRQRPLKH